MKHQILANLCVGKSFAFARIPHVVKLVQESGATFVKAAQPAGKREKLATPLAIRDC